MNTTTVDTINSKDEMNTITIDSKDNSEEVESTPKYEKKPRKKIEIRAINKCAALRRGSTELCGRACVFDRCYMHRYRSRLGYDTMKPCIVCGKGVNNKYQRCSRTCGYNTYDSRDDRLKRKGMEPKFIVHPNKNVNVGSKKM